MDKICICDNCGKEFILSEREHAFFIEHGFHQPRNCPECKRTNYHYRSKKLKNFLHEIQYVNRNPQDNSVLEFLNDIGTNPTIVLDTDKFLYRARVVTDINKISIEKGFWGYSKSDSFIPPINLTKDMRANYRYIPYLYCSNSPYIALCETRPRFGTIVSVAKIAIKDKLEVFDLTLLQEPKGMNRTKRRLCEDLSEMFSKPVMSDDDTLNYLPTQYISEFIKKLGYDGLKYKSTYSIFSKYIDDTNLVIFNYQKCEPIKSNKFIVNKLTLGCKKDDEDDENIFDF